MKSETDCLLDHLSKSLSSFTTKVSTMARTRATASTRSSTHIAFLFLLLLSFIVAVSATEHTTEGSLRQRAEAAGSGCSPEGQWNCMTTTWQRCASGVWSVEMQMA